MTATDFAVWLRGFLAACGDAPLSAAQLEMVRSELAKVVATPTVAPLPYPWNQPAPGFIPTTITIQPTIIQPAPSPFGGYEIICAELLGALRLTS